MIKNLTKKFILIKKKRFANSFFSKAFGLMMKKNPDYGLIFPFNKEKIISLTMWFVFFEIDVLYLNKNKEVVEIKRDFKPFTNHIPKNKAMYVIEFPKGKLKNTSKGDSISF
jgi:uncharacterized membrane protein (UPF0127 family)